MVARGLYAKYAVMFEHVLSDFTVCLRRSVRRRVSWRACFWHSLRNMRRARREYSSTSIVRFETGVPVLREHRNKCKRAHATRTSTQSACVHNRAHAEIGPTCLVPVRVTLGPRHRVPRICRAHILLTCPRPILPRFTKFGRLRPELA